MLMTNFTYRIDIKEDGTHITVIRLLDSLTKTFFVAARRAPNKLNSFMASVTDEQAESYFPKPRKK